MKPPQYLDQMTGPLRERDHLTVNLLKAQKPTSVELLELDPFEMASAAECPHRDIKTRIKTCRGSCFGAFESPDGTHMSPTLQINLAQTIFGAIRLLPE